MYKTIVQALLDIRDAIANGGSGGGGSTYELPVASASTLGGVKVGSGLSIESDGTMSASGESGGGVFVVTFTQTGIDDQSGYPVGTCDKTLAETLAGIEEYGTAILRYMNNENSYNVLYPNSVDTDAVHFLSIPNVTSENVSVYGIMLTDGAMGAYFTFELYGSEPSD